MDAINSAIHQTTSQYPGGTRKLAQDLGLQPGTFSNKCNPTMESHVINIKELVAISKKTGNLAILDELARTLDCVCIPIENHDDVSDMELLDAWSDWDIERSETIREIRHALDQHRISQAQIDRIEKEMFEDFRKELELLARLRGLVDPA